MGLKNYSNKGSQLNEGAFIEHQHQVYIDLFKDISKYWHKYSREALEVRVVYCLTDLMQDNRGHWIWDRFTGDAVNGMNIEVELTKLAKKLISFGMYTQKDNRTIAVPVDKFMSIEWVKEYKTPKAILIRHSKKGYVAMKSLSPKGLILKAKEFELFCSKLKINLDTFTWQQLERLISDFRMNPTHPIWKDYPSMKFFEESLEVEKKLKRITETLEVEYEIGKGYITQGRKVEKNTGSQTLNVFDF